MRGARPRLRRGHLTNRPLDAIAIDDDVRIVFIGGPAVGGEHMAVCIDTPRHPDTCRLRWWGDGLSAVVVQKCEGSCVPPGLSAD